ncbi:hypothetical protein [uncultured Ruminococcus sp.]|uniref:hypothetical protein n=1 Tax=uncultured Ruminococcus sp. TaxID=165186 RepID=UPI00263920A4|nr:hypothetical protein [uncultured Ruminococcus sp.]
MVKNISKKFLSILLTLCIAFSSVSLLYAGAAKSPSICVTAAEAAAEAPAKKPFWGPSFKTFNVNKLYSAGYTLCGNLLTAVANSTESDGVKKVVSILNKYVFGTSGGQAMAEIKQLCQEILNELNQIDTKLTRYSSQMTKIMGESQYNDAYYRVKETWESDVLNIEKEYNIRETLQSYKNYIDVANEYKEGSKTLEDVESANKDLFLNFVKMYECQDDDFDMDCSYEEKRAAVFGKSTINNTLHSAIYDMYDNFDNENNYADTVAQFAFSGLPFATDQYEYIKTSIEKQFMEILLLEMLHQEYLSQQGDYLEEYYPNNDEVRGNYTQEVSDYQTLNNDVAKAMEEVLDRELKVSLVDGIYLKLDEYPKPEDATTVVMRNIGNFYLVEGQGYPILSPEFAKAETVFNRVFTLTNRGINSFLILDGTQYDSNIPDDEIPYNLHLTRFVQKNETPTAFDTHTINDDFYCLVSWAVYEDGTNTKYKPISDSADISELFNTKAFALCDSTPSKYLSDYLSYTRGYPTYIMTPETELKGNGFSTEYVKFKTIDANAQAPGAVFEIVDVSAEEIQPDRENYNTAYSVILANENKDTSDNSEIFNQQTSVGVSGNGSAEIYIDNNGSKATSTTQEAGSEITVRFKPTSDNTVLSSITMQRFNDASNKSKVTSETEILERDQIEKLFVDENGYYIYTFNAPYSDIHLTLNVNEGHKVYVEGEDGSTDLVSLDAYSNLFAEGETVNIIVDRKVNTVLMEYGNVSRPLTLNDTVDGGKTASFVMPNCDVTLKYAVCVEHDFDSDGFCINCGFYQPAEFNSFSHYEIINAGTLYWFASLVNGDRTLAEFDEQNSSANAVVMNDIYVNRYDMNNLDSSQLSSVRSWIPIGTPDCSYTGNFEGYDHNISGLYFSNSEADNVGLFGYTRGGANIANVTVLNSYFEGNNCVGGILGRNNNSGVTVKCCGSEATVIGKEGVAGVVGSTYGGTIADCYNAGSVKGDVYVAAIRGKNTLDSSTTGKIENCFNVGSVTGTGTSHVGGIRGDGRGSIDNCYCISNQLTDTSATTKTPEQFASGEVAYLLNHSESYKARSFFQNLDNGEIPDAYPKFTGGTVYYGYACHELEKSYSNYPVGTGSSEHQFDYYGFCKICGDYQPAVLNNDNCYEISNPGMLYWFASLVNGDKSHADFDAQNRAANAVLVKDLVVNRTNVIGIDDIGATTLRKWVPIGNYDNSYTGKFDGQRFTISGLYYKNTDADNIGLFGCTGDGAYIQNLGVYNSHFEGKNSIGGIIGCDNSSSVEVHCCYSEAEVIGNEKVAGIVGSTCGGSIIDCYNAGSVTGNKFVGAIRGSNTLDNSSTGQIQNCFNVGSVTGADTETVGGISGDDIGSIDNCYCISNQLTDTSATTKTPEEFASGQVAYLLNHEVTDGTQVWYQNIDNGKTPDQYPKFKGGTVYYLSYKDAYSNTYSEAPPEPDEFEEDDDGNLLIKTYDDLVKLSNLVRSGYEVYGSQNYLLMNNIQAPDDSKWMQGIGSVADDKPFNGTFNGNGYCIMGLNVDSSDNGGLFEVIGNDGCVKDLFVFDCDFTSSSKVAGGITAVNKGTIDHCISGVNFTSGTIHLKGKSIKAASLNSSILGDISGGIAGTNSGSMIGCRNEAVIKGVQCGGIAGENTGEIFGCVNNAKIGTTDSSTAGGLAGKNNGAIKSSYNSGYAYGTNKGSISGTNGYNGKTPTVQNVFYIVSSEFEAVGTKSEQLTDNTNEAISEAEEFKTTDFVDKLNAVSNEKVVWNYNTLLNKGYPTVQGNFLKIQTKSAGNNITVKSSMHEDLNINYNVSSKNDDEYSQLASAAGEDNILKAYSLSLTDSNSNYIPAELWCQEGFEMTVPVDHQNIQLVAIDHDGNVTYYTPDSVENEKAVFTIPNPMSFAIVETVADTTVTTDEVSNAGGTAVAGNTKKIGSSPKTGEAELFAVLVIAFASITLLYMAKRRKKVE